MPRAAHRLRARGPPVSHLKGAILFATIPGFSIAKDDQTRHGLTAQAMLTPHPDFNRYLENLSRSELSPWRGVLFRSAAIAHASGEDLISGRGAELAGGRWNPPGLRTVYGSLNPGLSVDESLEAVLRGYGFNSEDLHPRVIAAIEVSLEAVLILDPSKATPEWIDYDAMLAVDWRGENREGRETASQALGRAVASAGEALITGSAVRTGMNIALFPERLRPASSMRIIHGDELPG
jgi:RES domain-containing protein